MSVARWAGRIVKVCDTLKGHLHSICDGWLTSERINNLLIMFFHHMRSNNSRPSISQVGQGSSGGKLKLTTLCVVASVTIFSTAVPLNAHKVTSDYELKPIPLPGASGVVSLDYFAYDRSTGKLWVPASNTGNVDVIDENSDAVSQVSGFKTGEAELRGRKVPLGPTAVSIGDGVAYIGNRGDSSLCVIDAQSLKREGCLEVAL